MNIVETSVFTRRVVKLLPDDEYRLLQHTLVLRPDLGAIIKGSGGIRKMRWKVHSRGKRGGVRVIYYWAVAQDIILMLLIYRKGVQDNLTSAQIKILRKIVETEYP